MKAGAVIDHDEAAAASWVEPTSVPPTYSPALTVVNVNPRSAAMALPTRATSARSRLAMKSFVADRTGWHSQGKSEKALESIRLPVSDLQSPPLSRNDYFGVWQTPMSYAYGLRHRHAIIAAVGRPLPYGGAARIPTSAAEATRKHPEPRSTAVAPKLYPRNDKREFGIGWAKVAAPQTSHLPR